jgi:hypothetical protein
MQQTIQNMFYKKGVSLFLTTLLAVTLLQAASIKVAAQGVSLGISPTVIQIDAKPPASITTPITLENNGDTPLTLQIRLKGFTSSPKQDGHVEYYPEKDPRSSPEIFEKIQITENDHPRTSITLAPGEKKALGFHIGIPKNEPLADYYFSIIFISKAAADEAENSASQTPAGIATNVLLSIGPKGPTTGEIEKFSAPLFLQSGPVPFTVKLKNTSDHLLIPKGEILITNMFGQKIGRVNLLPVNILSKTARSIPDSLQSPEATLSAAITQYLLENNNAQPAAVWPETFLLGPYTAQLTIALSDQGPVFRRQIHFFAAPLSVIIGIVLTILISIYLGIRIRKRLQHPHI